MSKKLIIIIGNIGSGKSTYTERYQKKDYVIIARDSFRYGLGGGKYVFNYEYEPIVWKTELYMFRKFVEAGVNIVIDEVGLSKNMRKRYIPYAKKNGYKIIAIEMPRFSMDEAVSRRMTNPHGQSDIKLWEQVWTKFNSMYEVPSKDEGIDEIIKVKKEEVS